MASSTGSERAASPAATYSTRPASSRSGTSGPGSSSNLESTITRLLVATKQLLEGLAKWSRGETSEATISEIYVKLGNDFNVACAAFAREGISMNELMSIPSELRVCLESCLSEVPTPATLERHLPKVRQIIIGLLHGLREKQRLYREGLAARRARNSAGGASHPPAAAPGGSGGPPLTPNSAGRSREDLRRFVTQTQAGVAGQEDPSSRRYSSEAGQQRRSASDSGSTGTDQRLSAALSSRGSGPPSRSGSMRETNRSSRSTFEGYDAFAPPAGPGAPPHFPRTNSTTSIESVRSATSASGASSTRANAERRMVSPPPPSRQYDTIPAVPRTPTLDSTLPLPPSSSQPTPTTVIRPPSVASNASSFEDPYVQQAQAASLEALKASDNLSRRASKRYSAYAIQKMTSPTPGSTSPSASAMRSPNGSSSSNVGGRGDLPRSRSGDLLRASSGSSAGRELAGADLPRRSKSEYSRQGHGRSSSRTAGAPPMPAIPRSYSSQGDLRAPGHASPILEEEEASPAPSPSGAGGTMSPPPSFPPPPVPGAVSRSASSSTLQPAPQQLPPRSPSPALPPLPTEVAPPSSTPTSPPPPSEPEYPYSVFLQIGRDVKKARLGGPPDIQSLRQLFVERFGYNPGLGNWPDVYLRDTDAGVHYELEDMAEIRPSSVLSLNVDTVEQVKQHIDQGLDSLASDIKELRATVTAMRRLSISAASLNNLGHPLLSPAQPPHVPDGAAVSPTLGQPRLSPSEKQYQQAAQKVLAMRKLHSTPNLAEAGAPTAPASATEGAPASTGNESTAAVTGPPAPSSATSSEPFSPTMAVGPIVDTLKSQHGEVQNLRREIGILRQVYADFTQQTKEMFGSVRVQTSHVQHLARSKLSTDRAFVEAGTQRLDSESTNLVVQVDELQDTIETLRTDTVRGIKPRPQQLSEVAAALRKAMDARTKLAQWLKDAKPTWSQMWSVELSKILAEQKAVEEQGTLLVELEEDLDDVDSVLKNIQAVAKQLKGPGAGRLRDFGGGGGDDAKDGLSTALLEIKALRPDPSRRLEAIARAERQRELELANRTDEFAEELGDFVGKGKLKKSGGIEETERLRQMRSEATLRSMFQS
ncbi:formin-mediated actin nucleation enhancer [Rhodotorula paludigena]|uniref:formin-mediated actin nucleation enhancer n=1 Tax=Rhodotorula paludigena TaxID=86838 RepID=UPI00316EBCBD